jgi:hypothetical protein
VLPLRTAGAGVAEAGDMRNIDAVGVLGQSISLHALCQLLQRRQGAVRQLVAVGDVDIEFAWRNALDPQSVGHPEFGGTEDQHRLQVRQRQHLHAMIVAFDDEQQVVHDGDAIGAIELAGSSARAADSPQIGAAVGIEDHQIVGILGRGEQPRGTAGRLPGDHRINVVDRRRHCRVALDQARTGAAVDRRLAGCGAGAEHGERAAHTDAARLLEREHALTWKRPAGRAAMLSLPRQEQLRDSEKSRHVTRKARVLELRSLVRAQRGHRVLAASTR